MFLEPHLLPTWLVAVTAMAMIVVLGIAARSAPWRQVLTVSAPQHLVLGTTVALLLLWLGTVQLADGVHIHFLAVTFATMLVGWPLALIAGTVALAVRFGLLGTSFVALPVAWLLTVAVPATATRVLLRALRRHGPRHLFLYLLGAGFGGGMVAVLATTAAALALLAAIGQWSWIGGALDDAPLLVLMLFPEGFLNGMLVTAFTVFHPQLMKTFDADHYLE